ncbi:MAG: MFS transporter [Anaerofustis stercorihominis]|nr:MFS transporter [Anaerofustis stercorihominis]
MNAINDNNWKKRFTLIAASQVFSILGSSAVQFSLIWHLSETTASALMLGFSGLAAHIPMALLSPIAGIWADKYDRKLICIISDAAMGVMALLYAVMVYFFDAPSWSIIVMLFIRGIASTVQYPATQSIIPLLVPKEELVRVNGVMQMLRSGTYILGPVLGAMLYAAFPLHIVLLTDTLGAVFACLVLLFIKTPLKAASAGTKQESFIKQFGEGLAVYKEDKALLNFVICDCICMFLYSPLNTLFPLMTSDYFNLSAVYGSVAESMISVGVMLAAFLFSGFIKIKRKLITCYVGSILLGLSCAMGGMVPPTYICWYVFALSCFGLGAFSTVRSIPLSAYIQENVPKEKMGRAFSVLNQLYSIVMPFSLMIASPLADIFGVHIWYVISGLLIAVTALVFSFIHTRITGEKLLK